MNPLPAHFMSPAERRVALCKILAVGLRRLHVRNARQLSDDTGESSLHFLPDQCRHATSPQRRSA